MMVREKMYYTMMLLLNQSVLAGTLEQHLVQTVAIAPKREFIFVRPSTTKEYALPLLDLVYFVIQPNTYLYE
jgi:hypothetical protein